MAVANGSRSQPEKSWGGKEANNGHVFNQINRIVQLVND